MMRSKMNGVFRISLLAMLVLAGCAAQKPMVAMPPEPLPSSRPEPQKPAAVEPLPSLERLAGSEQPEPESAEAEFPAEVEVPVEPDGDFFKERLAEYDKKLARWRRLAEQLTYQGEHERPAGWYACLRQMESIQEGYRILIRPAADGLAGLEGEKLPNPWEVNRQDMQFLESECEEVFAAGTSALTGKMVHPAAVARKLEVVVSHYVNNGRYNDALLAYRNLEAKFPDWQPGAETKRAYGVALVRTGKLEEASQILSETLAAGEPCDPWTLKRLGADLLLATGQAAEARELYEDLAYFFASLADDDRWVADQLNLLETLEPQSAEMTAYQKVLAAYLVLDGRRTPTRLAQAVEEAQAAFPDGMVARYSGQLLHQARERLDGWVRDRLLKADDLVAKREFAQALSLLNELLDADLPPATKGIVGKTIESIHLAEERERERQQLQMEQDLASRWEEAIYLLDQERYDQAISLFSTLLETEYGAAAEEKKTEAINRAATGLRRQAADLFIKAREVGSPGQKKEFLLESRRLLKAVLEKYPDADISNKVSRNLDLIEKEIVELDPSFVTNFPAPEILEEGDFVQPPD